jgi:glucose/mannose transport system permease protein
MAVIDRVSSSRQAHDVATAERSTPARRHFSWERVLPPAILAPSLIASAIFVYVFIAITCYVSLSNWGTLKIDLSVRQPLLTTYGEMFAMPRFQADLRNTLIFTALFLTASVGGGLILAILLENSTLGGTLFRNVFLFPYALSFIVTGVAWRWIFNPETGINLLFQILGINKLLAALGAASLKPGWLTDPQVLLSVNALLAHVWPAVGDLQVRLGIPAAIIPVVIAAAWQLSGFAMAMYLAGLGTIPNEVREAARIDGAGELQLYRYVVIPMLNPITVSTLIILGHVSLKIFDLIFAMSGVGPGFATDVPGIFVFEQTFKATRYNLGAAASFMMLLFVALVIVPYLARSLREE